MKRVGHLWPQVVERGNLLAAFHRASRGKRGKAEVRRAEAQLDALLDELRTALLERRFEIGRFNRFKVYDPKERTIHAAHFEERVFQHALIAVCEPWFERQLIYHTYACRVGKGRLKALAAASRNARRARWYLKLDIRKYFESIPHQPLLRQLRRLFKDPEVLYWFERIIGSHHSSAQRGLPIGSLTSQHLANLYLSPLDRLCQDAAGVVGYVRYMDDFVCWSSDKASLLKLGRAIEAFAADALGLTLKFAPAPQRVALGMDFLGCRLFTDHTRLARRSKLRYRRKLALLGSLAGQGVLSEAELQARLCALTAFTLPVCSFQYRQRVLASFWSVAIGHEPRATGWQLEQQREQLPCRQPQQQQPRQPQQQQRLPPRPQLRPTRADRVRASHQGTEPATDPTPSRWGKAATAIARASSVVEAISNARRDGHFFQVCATLRERVHAVAARLGNRPRQPDHLNFNPYYYENT